MDIMCNVIKHLVIVFLQTLSNHKLYKMHPQKWAN